MDRSDTSTFCCTCSAFQPSCRRLSPHTRWSVSASKGTLEPVLATPIRRQELLLGKALAALLPSLAVAYALYGLYLIFVAA